MERVTVNVVSHLDGWPVHRHRRRGEGVARASDARGDDRADMHRQGAIGAEVPPGADAGIRDVFGDPVTDGSVSGWSLCPCGTVSRRKKQSADDGEVEEEGRIRGGAAHAGSSIATVTVRVFYLSLASATSTVAGNTANTRRKCIRRGAASGHRRHT